VIVKTLEVGHGTSTGKRKARTAARRQEKIPNPQKPRVDRKSPGFVTLSNTLNLYEMLVLLAR